MPIKDHSAGRVRLGAFEVDLRSGELYPAGIVDDEGKTLLREQPFQVLQMLIEGGGKVVSREEIRKRLWPNDTMVDFDHSINVVIGILRRALGDSADRPQYIETLARRGYRLRVAIEWLETKVEAPAQTLNAASPVAAASLIGRKVSHYRVIEVIGGGGMGMVYKAQDLRLGRSVALKFLPEEVAHDPLALKRFEREAQTASALNHANICTIYEIEEYEGQPFIAMELLEGDSLQRLDASESGQTSLAAFLDMAIQICDGLQAAHDKGIIHRDIKPGNLFLTHQGQVKILDFGLAKAVASEELVAGNPPEARDTSSISSKHFANDQTAGIPAAAHAVLSHTGPAMGTSGYMSPEQLRKEQLDARTDLFSFGIVLYEVTTGRRPFHGDSLAAVHDAILTQTPLAAHDVNPAIPRRLDAIINKAMEKDRSHRYQSAAEIRADLVSVQQQMQSTGAHTRKWLAAGALLASLALATVIFWRAQGHAPLSPNETIVIAIHNETRDPAFNDALYVPLGVAMEQTPYFTALPLTKAVTAFNALHLSGDPMKLSPQTARPVCVQTSSKLVMAATIAETGNGFVIELQAIECQSGKTIATVSEEAPSRARVVHALGLSAAGLRRQLGEPEASVAKFNKPLEEASSASPEALEMLLEGYKRHLDSDFHGAISNYQRALELDPNLGAALTALAAAAQTLGEDDLSVPAITRAYQLRDRLTDPVRAQAESLYYNIVTGESEKDCAVLSQFVRRFPDDFIAHNNFARCLQENGKLDLALAEARDSSRLYPSPFSYNTVIYLEIATDRLDEAAAKFAEADAQKFDSVDMRRGRALLAFLQHDSSRMQEQWKWAEGKPDADHLLLDDRAAIESYYGRYRAYRKLEARARQLAANENSLQLLAKYTAAQALGEAEAGNLTQALQLAEEGRKGPHYRAIDPTLALAFARAGDSREAQELTDAMSQDAPLDTSIQNYFLPIIRASIEIHDKNPAEAVKYLERTRKYEFAELGSLSLYAPYVRGLAYLEMGNGPLAKAEFQTVIDHPGLVGRSVIGALSHLQLARAQKLSGDAAGARKSYEYFLGLWKDADPDLPIYKEARAEYAVLRKTTQ